MPSLKALLALTPAKLIQWSMAASLMEVCFIQVVPTHPCRGIEDWDVASGHCPGEAIWDEAARVRVAPTNTVPSPAFCTSAPRSIASVL